MWNPYRLRRIYNTGLGAEQIRLIIRCRVSERGLLPWIKPYRGCYRSGRFILFSQSFSKSTVPVKISGKINSSSHGTQVKVTYQPVCSPFYILIPLFIMLTYIAFNMRSINDEQVSRLSSITFSAGAFLLIGMAVSLINFKSVKTERTLLEQALQITDD